MFRIEWVKNGEIVFTVSGQMDGENIAELKALLRSEATGRHIVFDLRELRLVDQDAVRFLGDREAGGVELKNCSPYIRAWITRERGRS